MRNWKSLPGVGPLAKAIYFQVVQPMRRFPGSGAYWESRYRSGRTSGAGSYNRLAQFKSETINRFVADHDISTVVEHGCGDGNQLSLAEYPQYTGVDISSSALDLCRARFEGDPTKVFAQPDQLGTRFDLSLSLDVIYHLVEDSVFEDYMGRLFASSDRYVIVYSSNTDKQANLQGNHIRHRRFTDYVATALPEWEQCEFIANPYPYNGDDETTSFADFYFFRRTA